MMIGNTLDPSQDVATSDWFLQNAPPGTMSDGGMQTTMPAPRTGGSDNIGTNANAWIDQALQTAQSTDDPNYWYGVIAADPKVAAGDQSAIQYWQQRIAQGDGALAVRNGTTPKFQDGGTNPYGAASSGFGAAPAPYASNPNAPTAPGIPMPTGALASPYVAPQFAQPSVAEVEARPGYQIGLNTGLQQINRSAAAKGSVLNPGTVQALNRYGTDYAGTQYGNVLAQDLGIFQTNTSADLAGRQQNQTEFQQNVVQPTQTQFQNQYASYLNDNARTLNDYLTNYNIAHTADTDYWGRLKDVSGAGLTAALGDKAS